MGFTPREISPSRVLNDQRGIFGLQTTDFGIAIFIFMGGSAILDGTGVELLSIPVAVATLIVLSPLRLSTRRKIVRDFIKSILRRRILYDPR